MTDLTSSASDRSTTRIIVLIAMLLVVLALAMTVIGGIPGLTMFALIGTALSFFILIVFAMGG